MSDDSRRRHDLRSPLNGVIGFGELLVEDGRLLGDPATAELGVRVVGVGRRLLGIIDGWPPGEPEPELAPSAALVVEACEVRMQQDPAPSAELAEFIDRVGEAASVLRRLTTRD